jgi:hypothetical protein
LFAASDWGRAVEVKSLLEPWAKDKGVLVASQTNGDFAVAIDLPAGEEKHQVIRQTVDMLKEMGVVLASLNSSGSRELQRASQPILDSSNSAPLTSDLPR